MSNTILPVGGAMAPISLTARKAVESEGVRVNSPKTAPNFVQGLGLARGLRVWGGNSWVFGFRAPRGDVPECRRHVGGRACRKVVEFH